MEDPHKRVAFYGPTYSDYVPRLLDGILRFQAERGGFTFSDMRSGEGSYLADLKSPPPWDADSFDGVITFVGPEAGAAKWLTRPNIPVVNTSGDFPVEVIPCVHLDDQSVVEIGIDHLLQHGIRYFAYIGDARSEVVKLRAKYLHERLQNSSGFASSYLHRLEYCYPIDLEKTLEFEPELPKFLLDAPKPLGILCANDFTAATVCRVCESLKIEIPTAVSVIGVDDSAVARFSAPAITSIRPPAEMIGYQAMRLLNRIMSGEPNPDQAVLVPATTIVQRESTMLMKTRTSDDVSMAIRIIAERACEGLQVSALVAELNISRKTLERHFQEKIGSSPAKEIRRVRVERAKELLSTSNLPIANIAQQVGFQKPSTFSAFFKKATGLHPRKYRSSLK